MNDANLHIIDVIDGQIFDFEPIFDSEQIAKGEIQKDIEELIASTYDYFPGHVSLTKGMIVCAFYHRKRKDLIGTIALYHYQSKGIDYIELGLSLIAPKYRKMGFQSVEARRIREFGYFFLRQQKPFYISARMASATTQLQVSRGKMNKPDGSRVNVAYPKGFLPQYIANKNNEGQFMLEFGLFYEAWATLDKTIEKAVYFPDHPLIHKFRLLKHENRSDLLPNFIPIKYLGKSKYQSHSKTFSWDDLKDSIRIFGNLKTEMVLFDSPFKKFKYSHIATPNSEFQAILIESIDNFDFLSDIVYSMKSINVYVQISDFETKESKLANCMLIDQLINSKFVPTCIFDILYKKKRIRLCLFARWQNIAMQHYFEFLPQYETQFQILWHDCQLQGLDWKPEPLTQVMTAEKIQEYILVERFKSIF